MAKKTTKIQEEPIVNQVADNTEPPALSHPNAFSISLRAVATEAEIILNRLGYLEDKCKSLEATNYTLQQIHDGREKLVEDNADWEKRCEKLSDENQELHDRLTVYERSGEPISLTTTSGQLYYQADSIPLQTMMETLAEVLAVLPANEVNTKLNNILVLL